MNASFKVRALLWVSASCLPWAAVAQPAALSGEQQEADYRVIAARCGTPGFEKAFYKQSKAAVAAGLVVKHRDPVQVEKTVTALRRNPVVLIGTQADCAEQVVRLRELQKERAKTLGTPRKSGRG